MQEGKMELDLKEFGATIATGATFLVGVFVLVWAAGYLGILREHAASLEVPHVVTVSALMVIAFASGLISESLSHEIVHGPGRWLHSWPFRSETALRSRAFYGKEQCCRDVSELAVEASRVQLLATFAGDAGSRIQLA